MLEKSVGVAQCTPRDLWGGHTIRQRQLPEAPGFPGNLNVT